MEIDESWKCTKYYTPFVILVVMEWSDNLKEKFPAPKPVVILVIMEWSDNNVLLLCYCTRVVILVIMEWSDNEMLKQEFALRSCNPCYNGMV